MKKCLFFLLILSLSVYAQEIGAKYLIITHDNFYNDIQPLAQWKHKKGRRTKVVRLSQIGSSSNEIRNYIVNAYNNWQIRPEFLLLVGAPNFLPWGQPGPYSDNYYTNMNVDIYNEILSGRLTVHNTTEAQTVVNKILLYERTPDLTNSSWFIDACLIVREDYDPYDDSIYWSDARHARSLMQGHGYHTIDTLSRLFGNGSNDIIQRVNNGRAFVLYRGQGVGNWWSPFDVNPHATANGSRLPIVLSITCSTIGWNSTPATAEQWLLTGSPTSPRGAAGYFATTRTDVNVTHLRSAVCRGFFSALFEERKRTFGEACEGGRRNQYNQYNHAGEYLGFTTLGDPEMNIWTATPQEIQVTHASSLDVGAESLIVLVTINSVPLESALVCIVLDDVVYEYGYTFNNGKITFYFDSLVPGAMDITVTGKNLYPYEAVINIVENDPFLTYTSHNINDSLYNNNGVPEVGETILLRTLIKNIGLATATNVVGRLRSSDTFISFADSIVCFGNLAPQDSSFGFSPFVVSIAPFCPNNHMVDFGIFMYDSLHNNWTGNFSINISNPFFGTETGPDEYGYYIYDDTDTLSSNAPVFDWFEIAPPGPGIIISEITDEDADTVSKPLPFTFKFYGISYTTIGLCSNGFLEMGNSTYRFGEPNGPIPSPGGPKKSIAPFWDDLDPRPYPTGYGDIYSYHDAANHRWIVEFKECGHYGNPNIRETFQVQLRDAQYYPTPTGDGEILYLYSQVADATNNTVGIEDETETRGLQYVFNNDYDQNAAPIANQRALLITTKQPTSRPRTPWLHISNCAIDDSAGGNNNGVVEPDEIIEIYIYIQNSGDTTAHNVISTLCSDDNDVQIIDSTVTFGDVTAGSSVGNLSDPYTIHVSANPSDSTIGFILNLTANDNTYQKTDYFTIYIYGMIGIEEQKIIAFESLSLNVFPNPFKHQLVISIAGLNRALGLLTPAAFKLKIYDVCGRVVKSFDDLVNDQIVWNGTDENGRCVASGIYFVSLDVDGNQRGTKIILLK